MDKDGYLTNAEFKAIEDWQPDQWSETFIGLFKYIKTRWKYADCGYWHEPEETEDGCYHISTGGWSGNEAIIGAMKRNSVFWLLCWQESKRGGHYKFRMR